MAALFGLALAIPVCLILGFVLAPRAPTRLDRRARGLAKAIRRHRLQRAAKSELDALAEDWESVGRDFDSAIDGRGRE